ncbi:MAG: imidazoleglycerol-phosphate dehydratase HisB [Chloroflexota bacterium]|nr:MAG: imidazoleglycerol-phosphate dehydratase HisB [Chloroflexota bacterium]
MRPDIGVSARVSTLERRTGETDVRITLNLDGKGLSRISTGIGYFDHMLSLFSGHGRFDLTAEARGDLNVDAHHTVEDVGIVLGRALHGALGDKRGIARYGHAYVPMDEALVRAVVDLSDRPYCVYEVGVMAQRLGTFETELAEDFWYAVASNGRFNLHIDLIHGRNSHHVLEASFKSVARALHDAVLVGQWGDEVPSTKGMLGDGDG